MLPDRFRELLTAYVDGELTTRQRKAVARLLHRSEEARTLLEQLQQDAETLRGLPRQRLDRDLSSQVLLTIHQRRLHPGRRRVTAPPPAFPAWTGLAAAAAVLFVIGVGSYMYFAHSQAHDQLARAKPASAAEKVKKDEPPELPREDTVAKGNPPADPPKEEKPGKPRDKTSPEVAVKTPDKTPLSPLPPMKEPEPTPVVETSPTMELFKPSAVNPPQLLLLSVHELDQEKPAQQLREKLQKDAAYRVELPCKDGTKAFERLQTVLKAHGFGLVIEQGAQARLKTRLKTNYVLYVEDLTPDEVTRLLKQLGDEDKKAEAKRRGDEQFDMVVVNQLTKDDHKELSELLGINPTQFQPSKPAAPLGVDPRKPLSESTAEQVSKILAGQGGAPRPDPAKPAVKPPEHQALVMAYNPVRPRPGSAEVKRFLESRKPSRAGTVQVLLVLRGTNG